MRKYDVVEERFAMGLPLYFLAWYHVKCAKEQFP